MTTPGTFFHTASDGARLHITLWTPEDAPRGVVVLVHGYGEHAGRYAGAAEFFAGKGLAVLIPDQRGYGKTPGKPGVVRGGYRRLLADVSELCALARKRFPNVPLLLYGHSMGGNIALRFARAHAGALAAVTASAPWLRLYREKPRPLVWLSRAVGTVFPGFTFRTPVQGSAPKRYKAMSGRVAGEVVAQGRKLLRDKEVFPIPALVLIAGEDRVVQNAAIEQWATQAGAEVRRYPGFSHELHGAEDAARVFADVWGFWERFC